MRWLWLTLEVLASFLALGVLVSAIGDMEINTLFEAQPSGSRLRRTASGFVLGIVRLGGIGAGSAVLLVVVFAPAVLLFYFCHASYGISAGIGLPLGFGALIYLMDRFVSKPAHAAHKKAQEDKKAQEE